MVHKLLSEVRRKVVELWLDGNSYSGIHHKVGPSTGTSSSIISQLRRLWSKQATTATAVSIVESVRRKSVGKD